MTRAEVLYSGYVQGVGFRFTARSVAAEYAVAGFVRNLASSQVQVIAEGEKGEIEGFLRELASVMGHHIDKVEAVWAPATGEFKGFSIRF